MMQCTWTPEQDKFLRSNYGTMQLKDIAHALRRATSGINDRVNKLGIPRTKRGPQWSAEDIHFLRENWGKLKPQVLAKRLGRSVNSIMVKCNRLELGPANNKSLFTKRDICKLLRVDHRKIDRWIEQGLLSAKIAPTSQERGRCRNILQVRPQELLRFLQDNPDQWDARDAGDIRREINAKELLAPKVEIQRTEGKQRRRMPEDLRPAFADFVASVAMHHSEAIKKAQLEPDWLRQKKLQDVEARLPRERFRWTPEEDERLRRLFRKGEMTDRQIGLVLGRSEAAIRNRLTQIQPTIWEKAG